MPKMREYDALKAWLLLEQHKKLKWWKVQFNIPKSKRTKWTQTNMDKVFGKLNLIDDILKFLKKLEKQEKMKDE